MLKLMAVDSASNTVQDHSGSHGVNKVPPARKCNMMYQMMLTRSLSISSQVLQTHFDISGLQGSHIHSEQPVK